jgi:hypothetical protein
VKLKALATIHPTLAQFDCPLVPTPLEHLPALCLGFFGGHQDHRVPRAPLPGVGVTHHQGDAQVTSGDITPPSQLLWAHAPDHGPPHASVRPSVVGSVQVVASPCWTMTLPDIISAISVEVLGPIPRRVRQVHMPTPSPTAAASRHEKHVRHTGETLQDDFYRERYHGGAVIR